MLWSLCAPLAANTQMKPLPLLSSLPNFHLRRALVLRHSCNSVGKGQSWRRSMKSLENLGVWRTEPSNHGGIQRLTSPHGDQGNPTARASRLQERRRTIPPMRPKKRSASKPRAGRRTAGAASSVFTSCLRTAQVEVFPGSRVPVLRVDGGNLSRSFNHRFRDARINCCLQLRFPWLFQSLGRLPIQGTCQVWDLKIFWISCTARRMLHCCPNSRRQCRVYLDILLSLMCFVCVSCAWHGKTVYGCLQEHHETSLSAVWVALLERIQTSN